MYPVSEDLLLPAIGYGALDRSRLRDYLAERYPKSKSTDKCAAAIAKALADGGIVRSERAKIRFSYREVSLPSFAFVIHSEFPEPRMYEISRVEENQAMRALLWNPDRLIPALYELRNIGVISKISEIDSIRQFTTRYTLDEVVEEFIRDVVA
jgi:hypothetical protein